MELELEFREEEWAQINEYLSEWDDWRQGGRPDFTDSAIYLVPMTIALLRSEQRLEKLTWALVGLTIVLAVLTALNVVSQLGGL